MIPKKTKSIGFLILIIVLIYGIHKILFSLFECNKNTFIYSLEHLYFFFGLFSIVIQIVLIKVKQKNIDIVGNVFLLLTLFKMVVSYVLATAILKQEIANHALQKWNFFILFIVFLTLETVSTIRLLNEKEK